MAISIKQLKKSYVSPDGGVTPVLDVESFDLASGEQVALVGGSGSGKTTLLHTIAGIVVPDSGQVVFHTGDVSPLPADAGGKTLDYKSAPHAGTDLTKLSESGRDAFRGRNIGYVFQTHHLLSGFTALENVLLGMSFTGRRADAAWAKHLLDEVGLGQRLNYQPSKLSVGQQQRVAVARALANKPKLVLADEPTGALDPTSAQVVLDLIRKLCTEINASLLLVSHDMTIARQLGRSVDLKELNRSGKSH